MRFDSFDQSFLGQFYALSLFLKYEKIYLTLVRRCSLQFTHPSLNQAQGAILDSYLKVIFQEVILSGKLIFYISKIIEINFSHKITTEDDCWKRAQTSSFE